MDNKLPLVIGLPANDASYFEILGKEQAATLRSGLVTLQPGQDVGPHNTESYEEMIIVLEGEGELETDLTGRIKIARGQIAFNPTNTQHNVINTGKTPMKYIYIIAKTM
jgi:quercetin dioxygenase-like cupin family protein